MSIPKRPDFGFSPFQRSADGAMLLHEHAVARLAVQTLMTSGKGDCDPHTPNGKPGCAVCDVLRQIHDSGWTA